MTAQTLQGKRVLLCVGAGIAAYKCCELVRRLGDLGAVVQVAMTERAAAFVTPLTLQALSGRPVRTSLFDSEAEAAMGHIELARWADLVVYAPASADLLARLAHGIADDLVTTLALATTAPQLAAPAMNQQMWQHAATQANLTSLRSRGMRFVGPNAGDQACGEVGPGRMAEPDEIRAAVVQILESPQLLSGRHVLITAGPTREAIDPVRYISNHSTGRQGFALAAAAASAGARVTLVSGPTDLATPAAVTRIDVQSAQQMYDAVMAHVAQADLFIGVAAVADYRPVQVAGQKMKKAGTDLTITLTENPDILATVAQRQPRPFVVGFAAETERVLQHAREKRRRKRADVIIVNDVSDQSIGFSSDQNAVTLIREGDERTLPRAPKSLIAAQIIAQLAAWIEQRE